MKYSIGEFSKMTGLTTKAIHLYQEMKILVPSAVDEVTGYRYFDEVNIERAGAIATLKEMQFSLLEIAELMTDYDDEAAILDFLEHKRSDIKRRIEHMKSVSKSIDEIIVREKAAQAMSAERSFVVEEKVLAPSLIASIRWRGKYSDSGKVYARLGRAAGLKISGKPLGLYYDMEYLDEGADIESCFPVRKELKSAGVDCRELPGGRFATLVHCGPYDQLFRSYAKIFEFLKSRCLELNAPIREVYHKGPGMIFRGNSAKYITEIQFQI